MKRIPIQFLVALFAVGMALASIAQSPPAAASAPAQPAAQEGAEAQGEPEEPKEEWVVLETTLGDIVIRPRPDLAPDNTANFLRLSRMGFYDRTRFHRVIPGFMIQGGCPHTKKDDQRWWGRGHQQDKAGGRINVEAEISEAKHVRGMVGMARSGHEDPERDQEFLNTASSQFYICVADAPWLDGKFTIFGEVVKGMDVVDKIVAVPRKEVRGADGVKKLSDMAADPITIIKVKIEKH